MKKLLFGLALAASISSFANGACESESYQKSIQDYIGECKELILNVAKDAGCSQERLQSLKNNILAGNMSQITSESSTFCKVETHDGHYQVMTDDMPSSPVATIYFSRND